MNEFLKGRILPETYKIVYERFLPCVASSKTYKREMNIRMQDPLDNSELYSISDEAFTLLGLENYWDRWMDQCKDGMPRQRVGTRRMKEVLSDVEPKYTCGGHVYSDEKKKRNMEKDGIWKATKGTTNSSILFVKIGEGMGSCS